MSIWTPGRIPHVGNRFAMGVWLNYRKLASGVQIPSQRDRRPLQGKVANWYDVFPTTVVPPQQTQRGSFTAKGGMRIVALLGSYVDMPTDDNPVSTAGYQVQFFDAGANLLFSAQPMVWTQTLGNAQHPFWLRTPYLLKPNAQLTTRVLNLSPNPAEIEVVAFGYQN